MAPPSCVVNTYIWYKVKAWDIPELVGTIAAMLVRKSEVGFVSGLLR